MAKNVKCTKPDCDCAEKEEQRIGSPVKYGYPCLADNSELIKKATAYKNDKSLPENEQLKQEADNYSNKPEFAFNRGPIYRAFLAGASFVSQNRDEEIEKLNMIIRDCRASITGHKDEIQSMEREIQILEKTIDGYLNKKE